MTGTELAGTETRLSAAAAGEIIRTTVTAQPAFLADPTLAGAAEQIVSGSFVSLKRARHLRSCCGGLVDPPVLLGKALHDAAIRTAAEDHRFPPVSAVELEHLDMEVWLLFNPEPAKGRGAERIHGVNVCSTHDRETTCLRFHRPRWR